MNYESDHIQSIPKPQPFIGSLTGEVKELRERLDRGRHQLNNVDRRLAILESDADDDVEYMDKFPDPEYIVTKEQLQQASSWIHDRIDAVSRYANTRIDGISDTSADERAQSVFRDDSLAYRIDLLKKRLDKVDGTRPLLPKAFYESTPTYSVPSFAWEIFQTQTRPPQPITHWTWESIAGTWKTWS